MMRDMNIVFVCLLLAGLASLVELRRFRPDGDSDMEYHRNSRQRSSAHYKRWEDPFAAIRDRTCKGQSQGTNCPELYSCKLEKRERGKYFRVSLGKEGGPLEIDGIHEDHCEKVCINHGFSLMEYVFFDGKLDGEPGTNERAKERRRTRFERNSYSSSDSSESDESFLRSYESCDVCLCEVPQKKVHERIEKIARVVGLCNDVSANPKLADCRKVEPTFFV